MSVEAQSPPPPAMCLIYSSFSSVSELNAQRTYNSEEDKERVFKNPYMILLCFLASGQLLFTAPVSLSPP